MKSPPRPQDETPAKATDARLRLYNTLTRRKDDFAPIDPKAVRLYVCGPTVYDFAHIGNARPVIVFDVLFRLLRHLYGEDHVIYTRNITDVDDKINARAERDFPGLPLNEAIAKVTEATERQFHEDVAALGCLPPTHEPRATQHIDDDARDDRAADRARRRLCRRGSRAVLAERDGRIARGAALRGARPSLARRDDGRRARRCRALQARPDGLRPVEALEAERAGLAEPGRHRRARAPRLAYRVLGHVDGDAARAVRRRPGNATTRAAMSSTFTAAESISSFPTTRTKSRNPAAPSARRAWPMSGCTTASCRSKARRCRRASATSSRFTNFLTPENLAAELGQEKFCASRCFGRTIVSRSTGP